MALVDRHVRYRPSPEERISYPPRGQRARTMLEAILLKMDSDNPLPWPLPDALIVAREVLAGERGVFEGSVALARYARDIVPDWRSDPDFVIFGALASETDHLPFGEVRARWSSIGLAKADLEIAAITEAYRTKVLNACANLIARFGGGRQPALRTATLYRPVGSKELELIVASGWRKFPPRLPGQPIFYPVTNEAYAAQIARDWNVKESGAGFVAKFAIDADYLYRYREQKVGGAIHTEYWIPAENLEEFNRHIVDKIEVIAEFPERKSRDGQD